MICYNYNEKFKQVSAVMVTRKEDTASRVARRKYEEKNKELRKEKNANFQTMIPRELFEEINVFLSEKVFVITQNNG